MSIADLFQPGTFESVVVTRPTGSYVKGRWVAGTATTLTIDASVQPVMGRASQNREQGQDQSPSTIQLFTITELKAADETAGIRGDVVSWNGDSWEVTVSENRPHLDLQHFRVVAQKILS